MSDDKRFGISIESFFDSQGFDNLETHATKAQAELAKNADAQARAYEEAYRRMRIAADVAFAGVNVALGLAVRESMSAEVSLERARGAVKNAGGDWNALGEEIEQTTSALQRNTRFSDEAYLDVYARMVAITRDYRGSLDNLALVADVATAFQIDLGQAGDMVARAMEGVTGRLGLLLPGLEEEIAALGENATAAQKADVIMGRLSETKGRAAEAAKTAAGQHDVMKNSVSDLAEVIGGVVQPAVTTFEQNIASLTQGTGDWAKKHETATTVLVAGSEIVTGAAAAVLHFGEFTYYSTSALKGAKVAMEAFNTVAGRTTIVLAAVGIATTLLLEIGDAATATAKSEADLNTIVKETGVSYQTLRNKQEEIFGKFADYKSGTEAQRKAWDDYVESIYAAKEALKEVGDQSKSHLPIQEQLILKAKELGIVTEQEVNAKIAKYQELLQSTDPVVRRFASEAIAKLNEMLHGTAEKLNLNNEAFKNLMNMGLDASAALSLASGAVAPEQTISIKKQEFGPGSKAGIAEWNFYEQKRKEDEQRQKEHYQRAYGIFMHYTSSIQAAWSTAIETMFNVEMTGRQRAQAIWLAFRNGTIRLIGDIVRQYLVGEIVKRIATATTNATGIASHTAAAATHVAIDSAANTSMIGGAMSLAYAKQVAWWSFLGPGAPGAAAGVIGSAYGAMAGIRGMAAMGFEHGGIVPGIGITDSVLARLTPGERIIPPQQYQENRFAIEAAISGRRGGGAGSTTVIVNADRRLDMRDVREIELLIEQRVPQVVDTALERRNMRASFRTGG